MSTIELQPDSAAQAQVPASQEMAALKLQVSELSREVGTLRECVESRLREPHYAAVRDAMDLVARMTKEVFGVDARFEETVDAENLGDRCIIVSVLDRGELDAVMERFRCWHRRLSEVSDDVRGLFSLSIDPQE
jgi:hypothetical protein